MSAQEKYGENFAIFPARRIFFMQGVTGLVIQDEDGVLRGLEMWYKAKGSEADLATWNTNEFLSLWWLLVLLSSILSLALFWVRLKSWCHLKTTPKRNRAPANKKTGKLYYYSFMIQPGVFSESRKVYGQWMVGRFILPNFAFLKAKWEFGRML